MAYALAGGMPPKKDWTTEILAAFLVIGTAIASIPLWMAITR